MILRSRCILASLQPIPGRGQPHTAPMNSTFTWAGFGAADPVDCDTVWACHRGESHFGWTTFLGAGHQNNGVCLTLARHPKMRLQYQRIICIDFSRESEARYAVKILQSTR